MKIERLFQVLVVTGASSTAGLVGSGLVGCGSDNSPGPTGTGGAAGMTSSTGGSSSGTGGASGADCNAACHPDPALASWTDCNGCCCWLPAGMSSPCGTICGNEPCCVGRGR